MFTVISIITFSLLFQIYIIKKYQRKDSLTSNSNIENLLSSNNTYLNNKIVQKILDIHSSIYKKQMSEKNKETFFATLIHDLKTPVNAQIQALNLLLENKFGVLNPAQTDIIKETLNSEKYMIEIISNILTAYKCDCKKLNIQKNYFDIINQTNSICKLISNLAIEKGQTLTISYSKKPYYIYADEFQIKRVITNLVSNAVKYGLPKTKIIIRIENINNNFSLNVISKSHYIPQQKLSHIFDKFSASEASGYNNTGTGLGLYLSKKIIELHNGRIYAESFEDGTCIFGFHLKNNQPEHKKEISNIKV